MPLQYPNLNSLFPQLSGFQLLADAGQKIVFSALSEGRPIALKVIKSRKADRFTREVNAVKSLGLPYVPKILSSGTVLLHDKPALYLIEELISGRTLRQILEANPKRSLAEVKPLWLAMLVACSDFEKAKLVHRDLKPENLIIDSHNKLWILDFGLVRNLDLTSLTPTAATHGVGTWGYASLEQFRNQKREIDIRADLYAVGIMVYEMLAGSHPFWPRATNPLELLQMMERTDAPHLQIDGDDQGRISDLVAALMNRFPSRRPQTAEEALKWFNEVVV